MQICIQMSNRFYVIHSRYIGPTHKNKTASEAELMLQMLMYDGEKKAWNWGKYVAQHVMYQYQGLDPSSESWFLVEQHPVWQSAAVVKVRVHPDKYVKDFNAVVAFLTQYLESTYAKYKVCLCHPEHTCQEAENEH